MPPKTTPTPHSPTPSSRALACLVVLGAVVAVVASPTQASAVTLEAASLKTLIQGSAVIVEGRVSLIQTVEVDFGPGVFTDVTVSVQDLYKLDPRNASAPSTLTLRIPGGQTSRRHVQVDGMPRFHKGQRLLLILEPLPSRAWPSPSEPRYLPYGLEQGVFVLSDDGARFDRPSFGAARVHNHSECAPDEALSSFDPHKLRALIKHSVNPTQGGDQP